MFAEPGHEAGLSVPGEAAILYWCEDLLSNRLTKSPSAFVTILVARTMVSIVRRATAIR